MNFLTNLRSSDFLIIFVIVLAAVRSLKAESRECTDDTSEKDHHSPETEHGSKDEVEIEVDMRIDNIRKPIRDERFYRGLILHNGLRAVLISDPDADTSAASLIVNVGNMHDPEETPGLAHLLEHMLYMGSEKYPDENYYSAFMKEHSGYRNAVTTEDYQVYAFILSSADLAEALDITAQMVLGPLLTRSAMEREVNAVDSEYQMNSIDDGFIQERLERSLSKRGHGHAKFRCGNKATLQTEPQSKGIDVCAKLFDLFRDRFSSNMMYLVVLGRESLSDLEKMVVPLFGKIENKNLSESVYLEHPWGPEQLNRELRFVPQNDSHVLKIIFPSLNHWEYYKYTLTGYVRHLFLHEGSGSLISELREKNWIYGLGTWGSKLPGFGYFEIYIELTEKGVNHVNEIVKLIFEYFYLLRTNGIQKNIFDEVKKLYTVASQFKNKEDPLNHVYKISTSLQLGIPFEDVLTYEIPNQWDPFIIKGFLDYFVPENMNVLIRSKLFENEVDQVEQWYGTRYRVQRISEDLINEMWKITQHNHRLHIPPPNEFIPENFELYPVETRQSEFPRIIHESKISQFWFKQDDEFKIPKFYIRFYILNPMMSSTPKRCQMGPIFSNIFGKMLKTRVDGYTFYLAGLHWNFNTSSRGLKITLFGYSEKLLHFTKTFLAELVNFEILEEDFDILKENAMQECRNFHTSQPRDQLDTYLENILLETKSTMHEDCTVLETITVDDLRKYKKQFFTRVFIQGLIYGNCDVKLAKEVVSTIESAFPLKSVVLVQEIIPSRVVALQDGINSIFEARHEYSLDSGYLGYFQVGPGHPLRNIVLTSLFARIVSDKCFNTLRTDVSLHPEISMVAVDYFEKGTPTQPLMIVCTTLSPAGRASGRTLGLGAFKSFYNDLLEQLGYLVGCDCSEHGGIMSFSVWVQSARNPMYVNSRVEAFLRQLKQILIEMSPEEYETNKGSMKNNYSKKIISQVDMLNYFWEEIVSGRYLFEWKEEYLTQIDPLQKEDVIEFFETYIAESSSKRRKIDIHITSNITNPPASDDESIEKSVKIENSSTFPIELAAYPHIVSYRDVALPGIPVPL